MQGYLSAAVRTAQKSQALKVSVPLRALTTEVPGPKPRDPNRVRGDTNFVKRRKIYRDLMHEKRVELQKEGYEWPAGATGGTRSGFSRLPPEVQKRREERAERKRARSEIRQERAKELLEATRVAKLKRVEYKRKVWGERIRALEVRRQAQLQMLVENADQWITDGNLDQRIEEVIDAFFISSGDAEEEKGVKVVGWK